jgi:Protein phosphatase 2C
MERDVWRVAAVSVCGTSHEKTGQPCQDSYHQRVLADGVLVAAVADGAGSAARSELGSSVAVQKAVEVICNGESVRQWPSQVEEWEALLTKAFQIALQAIEEEAVNLGLSPRDLATTLILLIATPECVAVGQIGDGASVACDGKGNVIALTVPKSGEYINETTFLVSPDAIQTAQMTVWQGTAPYIAIFSDGLQMLALKMPDGVPHSPFFTPLFQFVGNTSDSAQAQEKLAAFLRSPRITARVDDDLTLLLAARI